MFRLGIVGHRFLTNKETSAFVSEECLAVIRRSRAKHPDIVAVSAIAEGTDTLFAEAALALDVPLEIVRPFNDYASDFTTVSARRRYEKLRAAARIESKLAYAERSDRAYRAAMHWIVKKSNVLVVAWNGLPARGSGGTGDAVKQAILLKRPWLHIDVTNLSVRFHPAGSTAGGAPI
jgi:hypothetical protein